MTTVSRDFTNELGNRIRITIEGPSSISENEITRREAKELALALVAEYVAAHPHLERTYDKMRTSGELGESGIADRALAVFRRAFEPPSIEQELRLYAEHLRTWTLADEEVGNVRPLKQLLSDAAAALTKQGG